MINKIITIIVTLCFVGKIRPAPGSWGSLVSIPFGYLILYNFGIFYLLISIFAIFILGVITADIYAKSTNTDDASEIVIDELAGQWLVISIIPINISVELTLLYLGIAFILFRIFDIFKPFFINIIDSKVKGGFGVMLDDIVAGIYGGGCLYLLIWYLKDV